MEVVVSVTWLNEHLNDKNLVILDATMAKATDSNSQFIAEESIPNSLFFDLKSSFSDNQNPQPNSLPNPAQFEAECIKLGISNFSKIVVYDHLGMYSSPRVWWMFRAMGHSNIAVLDGGFPEWKKHNFPTETEKRKVISEGSFKAKFDSEFVKTYEQVLDNTLNNNFLLVDARSAGRFAGTDPEPRKQLQSGSIPNSVNVPFEEVLTDGKFKSKEELKTIFESKNIPEQNAVFSCGSGLTACIILMAHHLAGGNSLSVYDGSWTEWAEKQNLLT